MLWTLCLAAFLISCTGVALSPFLLDISAELQVEMFYVANLLSLGAVPWGIASVVGGGLSDRLGRRPVLGAGLLVMGTAILTMSTAGSYAMAAACQILIGVGGGTFMGTVYAAVSERVPGEQRGRSFGVISVGQSLSLVLGVPLVTFIGSYGGWRGALTAQGGAMLVMALVVLAVVTPVVALAADPRGRPQARLRDIFTRRLSLLFAAAVSERVCFGTSAVYLATYFITTYGVQLRDLALVLGLVALGNLAGNLVGGRLADRVRSRARLFSRLTLIPSLLALPLLGLQISLPFAMAVGFVYSFGNGASRPAILTALSEVPAELRGTILGLNITCASIGWITSAAAGGVLLGIYGFWAIGALASAVGLTGAVLAVIASRMPLDNPAYAD